MTDHLTPHFLHGGSEHLSSGETSHALNTARMNYAAQQSRSSEASTQNAKTRERASEVVGESKHRATKAVQNAQAAPKSDQRIVEATKSRKHAEDEARAAQNAHGKNLSAHRAKRVEIEQQHDVIKAKKKEHGKGSVEHKGAQSDLKVLRKDYKKTGRAVHVTAVAGPVTAAKLRDARTVERAHKERAADNVTRVRNAEEDRHADVVRRAKIATKHDSSRARSASREVRETAGHLRVLQQVHRQVQQMERAHARESASATRARTKHETEMRGRLSKVSGHLVKLIGHGLAKSTEAPRQVNVQNKARL